MEEGHEIGGVKPGTALKTAFVYITVYQMTCSNSSMARKNDSCLVLL
jgi:hypothetical protein